MYMSNTELSQNSIVSIFYFFLYLFIFHSIINFFMVSELSLRSQMVLWTIFFFFTYLFHGGTSLPRLSPLFNNILPWILVLRESYQVFDHINRKLIDWSTQRHKITKSNVACTHTCHQKLLPVMPRASIFIILYSKWHVV